MQTTKEEYLREIVARVEQAEADIEALMVEATRSDYDEYLTDIRAKQEMAKAKLASVEEANGGDWHDRRAELERAVSAVENALVVVSGGSGGEES